MSAMSNLDYEIQEMFIDGADASHIAFMLKVPVDQVQAVLNSFGVSDEDCVAEKPHEYYGA